ncbi:MAG: Rrf2 family transcriptional regulator [Anaerolineaceae bacterium]|nr:Rrf2 family transcriptional regulator [Anaerolineaceae bacterium]
MLSNTSKYAIRATIYLALNSRNEEKIGIRKISADLHIPSPFLAKILQVLAKRKLLLSTKGPNGGFSLAKESKKITLYDIVAVIDGNDVFHKCLISMRTCHEDNTPCPVHNKYEPIRNEVIRLFKEQTIDDLAKDIHAMNQVIAL